jgi:hypothetical protein
MDERIKRSRAQEARLATRHDGTRNAGSGNGWQRKHDVRSPGILWECKRTDAKQITIKLVDMESARKEAWKEDRIPAFHIEIGDRRYIMMEEADAEERMGI